MLNHFSKISYWGIFFLIAFVLVANCNRNNNNCYHLYRIGKIEICKSSPKLSKYSYIILCQSNVYDTIAVYKAESNQILLFYRIENMDTIFLCDRWNNAHIRSTNIPIVKVDFNDSKYFFNMGKSVYRLRPEFEQLYKQ